MQISNDVTLHLFETTVILSDSLTRAHSPLQLVFALKEHNGGKLDSHRWFFNGVASQVCQNHHHAACIAFDGETLVN